MPKLKTHKGAKSRFHVTGSGKILRMKGHRSHLRRKKPMRVHRLFHQKHEISPADVKRIHKLLPYV
ncbi:MAG: 50S ribosomal protein L35 [Dehalococcoidia bacterium]|nr:50S ribosomal protein L35 [Dehalococcoidia bacterium]MQF98911.1 50S ribosomal protein L35 [SAR202 cluster bacterium]